MLVFTDMNTARAYAVAASRAYGRTVFINRRAGWPVYVTDYATRYTLDAVCAPMPEATR